jgi:hypothetical protein
MLFVVSCSSSGKKDAETTEPVVEVVSEPVHPMGFNPDTLSVKEGKVQNGQFFSTLLSSLGMGNPYALTEASSSVFDVRKFRIGQAYQAYYDGETLKYLVYERDRHVLPPQSKALLAQLDLVRALGLRERRSALAQLAHANVQLVRLGLYLAPKVVV